MIKISPAKNNLAIDHRAPQTDCTVNHEASQLLAHTRAHAASVKAEVAAGLSKGHREPLTPEPWPMSVSVGPLPHLCSLTSLSNKICPSLRIIFKNTNEKVKLLLLVLSRSPLHVNFLGQRGEKRKDTEIFSCISKFYHMASLRKHD